MPHANRSFASRSLDNYRKVHRYIMRRLRRPEDADDLAQEVYMRLCRIDEDKAVEKPLAYLYGTAAHVLSDHMFALKHRDAIDWGADAEEFIESPVNVTDDSVDRLNLQQQIDKAMAQLPPTHAAVLLLHKRDGLSYEEVAERLGLSIHTVEKYVTQSKARVRTMSFDR